jgi:hypothetical protein
MFHIEPQGGQTLLRQIALLQFVPSPHSPSKTGVNALSVGEGGSDFQQ